jgi:ComF family protein
VSLAATLREGIAPLVDLVYPPRCPLCGTAIGAQSGVCAGCWSELRIPGEPACASCQRPFGDAHSGQGTVCAPCMASPPVHDGIAAGTLYGDGSRKLVLAFKHGRRIALAPMLARLIVARLPVLEGEWLVIPVPLHRWRLWSRGFNQAALLAVEIARSTGASLEVDALVRTRRTPPLGGLGRKKRARTLTGAIAVNARRSHSLKNAQVILVDDVLTSGATSEACVRALKRAGVAKVVIACFARVLEEGSGSSENETPEAETPGAP